jgi:hypothetical protein
MTVKYGFYDSLNGDRLYNANDISTMFEGVFSDGVFEFVGNKLQVETSPGTMNVLVKDGRAWFNNSWIRNTSTLTLSISPSSFIHPRKDLVIIEFDSSITVRENSIKVLTGVPAEIPIAPTLASSSTLHQYALAEVYVGAGVSEIEAGDITNKIGTTGTPYATSLVYGPSTTAINDFQIGNGSGNWIKQTLSQTATILRNVFDSVYSLIDHTHDSSEIVSGTIPSSRLPEWQAFTGLQLYQNGNRTGTIGLARYVLIGDTYHVQFLFNVTGDGVAGHRIEIRGFPMTFSVYNAYLPIGIGSGVYFDSGSAIYGPIVCPVSPNSVAFFTNGSGDFLGATPSFAIANGDTISGAITFEAG